MTDLEILTKALREEAAHMEMAGLEGHHSIAIALDRVADRVDVLKAAQVPKIEVTR